jgi:hypothetical protein
MANLPFLPSYLEMMLPGIRMPGLYMDPSGVTGMPKRGFAPPIPPPGGPMNGPNYLPPGAVPPETAQQYDEGTRIRIGATSTPGPMMGRAPSPATMPMPGTLPEGANPPGAMGMGDLGFPGAMNMPAAPAAPSPGGKPFDWSENASLWPMMMQAGAAMMQPSWYGFGGQLSQGLAAAGEAAQRAPMDRAKRRLMEAQVGEAEQKTEQRKAAVAFADTIKDPIARNYMKLGQTDKAIARLEKIDPEEQKRVIDFEVAKANALLPGKIAVAQAGNPALGGVNLTPAQKAADDAFGKEYVEFNSGAFADAQKNIAQLRDVHAKLAKGERLTGPEIGIQGRGLLKYTNPTAMQALEQVEEVVQRNLRIVLGAQFTEKEGERLIARSYNPALPPEQNAERLGRLLQAMETALQAKQAMAAYYEKNGTLRGYTGKTRITVRDIEQAMEGQARPAPRSGNDPLGLR